MDQQQTQPIPPKKHRVFQTVVLVILLFSLFGIGIVVGNLIAQSKKSTPENLVSGNNTAAKTTVSPTSSVVPTTTPTLSDQPYPTTTSVTSTGKVTEPNFGYNMTVPSGWTAKTTYNEMSCDNDDLKSALKTPCQGTIKVPSLTIFKNGSPDSHITMFIRVGGMGGTCGDEESCGTPVASKVKVLGKEYDLGVHYFKSKNLYANPLSNAEIKTTGQSSLWKEYLVSINALGQSDFQVILSFFNNLK